MTRRQRDRDHARGRRWFNTLAPKDRFTLGDHFVFGCFDWGEWIERKPSKYFLRGAEEARIYWETTGEDL